MTGRGRGRRGRFACIISDTSRKTIWGLTATILIEVARRVFGREPEFQTGTDEGVTVWDVAERDGKTFVGVAPRSMHVIMCARACVFIHENLARLV